MIVDQLNSEEKCFLVMMSYFIDISAFKLDKMLAYTEPQEVLSEILSTARHHLHCLTKQTKLSPHFVVTVALLHMLMSLFTSDRMKYISLKQFLEAYPTFHDRSPQEQERLFHTANCMHILFQVINPKMKKGMVMEIVPKFVGKRPWKLHHPVLIYVCRRKPRKLCNGWRADSSNKRPSSIVRNGGKCSCDQAATKTQTWRREDQ